MRARDPPVSYLVGTPKGGPTRLETQLVDKPWRRARERVEVKLLAEDEQLCVFARSADRVNKKRAMRRRAPMRPPPGVSSNLLSRRASQSHFLGSAHSGNLGQVIDCDGGRTRARTLDPLIKSQLLYQLSYAPIATRGVHPPPARPACSKGDRRCPAAPGPFSRVPGASFGNLSCASCRPTCSCRSRASWRAVWRPLPRSDAHLRGREWL